MAKDQYKEIYDVYKKVGKETIKCDLFNHSNESTEEIINDIKKHKLVIYTAFTGDYDTLKEPEFIDENCDYICFSDNPNLKSDLWEIRPMNDSIFDNNRKAKEYKILTHKFLPEYKYSFWLDGTFRIKSSIREYIYKYLRNGPRLLNCVHTERDCVYDEYEASISIPRYPRAVLEEQVNQYRKKGFPEHYGLPVLGAIFKEHNSPEIVKLMEDWWEENVKFTNQDQISYSYVAWKNDIHPSVSLIFYWDNKYWAKEGQYHHKVVINTPYTSYNLKPVLNKKIEKLSPKDKIKLSKEELYLLINDVKGMKGYIEDTTGRINFLNHEFYRISHSKSLKITKPLRRFKLLIRKILKNPYLKTIIKSKLKFKKFLDIYKRIKNLGLFDEKAYLKIHPGCITEDYNPIFHYIYYSSKTDDIKTKKEYIDEIFDLYYYLNTYNIEENKDPLIHFVSHGFFKNFSINPKNKDFIRNLDETLDNQLKKYYKSKIKEEILSNFYITNPNITIPYAEIDEDFKTETIKIGVFLEDNFYNMNACPYIRVHKPLKELSKSGKYHFFVYGRESIPKIDFNKFMDRKVFDIIVIQRISLIADFLVEKALKNDIKIIYETDDDFADLKEDHPSFNYVFSHLKNIKKIVDNASSVVVSTNHLKESFSKKSNTTLIKNFYTKDILPMQTFNENPSNEIKIGYFGTMTHEEDLKILENIIPSLKEKFEKIGINVIFEVVGGSRFKSDWYDYIEVPYYPMDIENFMNWISKTINWDIGVIPLKSNHFNNSKSELKYIEFTALGVPTVSSNFGIYNQVIEDGKNGYLATDEEEWVNKLSKLIFNKDLRREMLNFARDDVLKNYRIQDRAERWNKLFKKVIKK